MECETPPDRAREEIRVAVTQGQDAVAPGDDVGAWTKDMYAKVLSNKAEQVEFDEMQPMRGATNVGGGGPPLRRGAWHPL